jgi:ferric-dicitrate binding protein FerR (iron transport regulator)
MRTRPLALLAALVTLAAAAPAWAQGTPIGTAVNAIGVLLVVRTDGIEDRLQGKGTLPLYEGDTLRTAAASQGMIQFREGIQVALNENTQLKVLSRWEKSRGITRIIRLQEGEVWVKTADGPPKQLEVETPVATAIVEGTEFNLKVQPDGQSVLTVISGVVQFGTPFGTCPIRPGTISYGERGKRCTRPADTNAMRAVEWTRALLQ